MSEPVLEIRNLTVEYAPTGFLSPGKEPGWQALKGVSFSIREGEVLAVVGESGAGKTTLVRALLRLIPAERGEILYRGTDLVKLADRQLKPFRKKIQVVFQDPSTALNPRMRVEQLIAEPMIIHRFLTGSERQQRVRSLMEDVGLDPRLAKDYPGRLSGGQRQRVALARALALDPELLIADEPVSALDVSVQAQILDLLKHLKNRRGLTLLLIAHDLAVVEQVADRVAVLEGGLLVELGATSQVFQAPQHPSTRALVESARRKAQALTRFRSE